MRVAILAVAAIAACEPVADGDPARDALEQAESVKIFAGKSWYEERPEQEAVRVGRLVPRDAILGPGDRGGLSFTWIEGEQELPVYSAGVESRLKQFVGVDGLRARGRVIDLRGEGFGREFWIRSVESPGNHPPGS